LTCNLLIRFDPRVISADRLSSELSALQKNPRPAIELRPAEGSQAADGKAVVAQAVVAGTLGHAAVDTLFYTTAAAATAAGWTWAAPLAAIHLIADVFIWGIVLRPVARLLWRAPVRA
jgi:hypothetical protein